VNVNECSIEVGGFEDGQNAPSRGDRWLREGAGEAPRCPSHGIGLTRTKRNSGDGRAQSQRASLYQYSDAAKANREHRITDEPGWITFSLDGRYAYPSTADVVRSENAQD